MSHVFSSPAQLENERLAAFIKQAAPGMPIVCWGKDHCSWLHECMKRLRAALQHACRAPLLSRLRHSLILYFGMLTGQVRRGGVPGKHYHYGVVSLPQRSGFTIVSHRGATLIEVLYPSQRDPS